LGTFFSVIEGIATMTISDEFTEELRRLEEGLPSLEDAGFLGANFCELDARLILIPVPWEATTSYGGGTSFGPNAIRVASHQLDLEDPAFGKAYRAGIVMTPAAPAITAVAEQAKKAAQRVIDAVSDRELALPKEDLDFVNHASLVVNRSVQDLSKKHLHDGKFVAVVGGDHSSPQGLIAALAEKYGEGFGILHFDAHHDLRQAYEGFQFSHASIFFNVMQEYPQVQKIVQVGIRDYCREERTYMEGLGIKGETFYSRDIFAMKAEGDGFKRIAERIVSALPSRVYVSFDIDALDAMYCPSTGTPVPGGLSFEEACYILEALANSGRKVIGFDLCEVTPNLQGGEWDANVGARMLYKLCGCLLRTQGLC
jgi:agmatinase